MAKKDTKDNDKPETTKSIDIKGAPQVNDVAKPGETPPPDTSRPIITNRIGIITQDPMVAAKPSEDKDEKPAENNSETISKKSEVKLEPVIPQEEDKPNANEEEKKPEESDDKAVSEPVEEERPNPEEDTKENPDEDTSDTSESAAIDSVATSAEARKNAAKESEDEQKKSEKIQELVTSKQYFVPIVEGGHKASSQRFASWLLLLLLLIAIGVYLAIDAGYLDVGVSLPFDFIKN